MSHNGFLNVISMRMALAILLILTVCGCGQNTPPIHEEVPLGVPPAEEIVYEEPIKETSAPGEDDMSIPDVTTTAPEPEPHDVGAEPPVQEIKPIKEEDYKVVVDVDDSIEVHTKGNLEVWIGLEEYTPNQTPNTIRNTTSMPSNLGSYARITPYAPDFDIDPGEPQIVRIHPSGTKVLFTLIPQKKGRFKIGAKIELFDNEECAGVGIPKASDIVSVVVTVDGKIDCMTRLLLLWDVVWENFVRFWGAFVALFFAALIFVIRKFIKKKTGYDEVDKQD